MSLLSLSLVAGLYAPASSRPHLAVDGGNIELVEVTDDLTVKIRWLGNCAFCSMSEMTMKAGVEQAIKSRLPEIKNVIAVNEVL